MEVLGHREPENGMGVESLRRGGGPETTEILRHREIQNRVGLQRFQGEDGLLRTEILAPCE